MTSIKFNGFIFKPRPEISVNIVIEKLQRHLGVGWTVESLGEVLDLYIIKYAVGEISIKQCWDLLYQLPQELIIFAEPDFNMSASFDKGSFIDCDQHLPGTQYENWARDQIKIPQAWEITPLSGGKKFGEGIIIGHTDTGYTKHQEIWDNGAVKEYGLQYKKGWNYKEGSNDALDVGGIGDLNFGHGTSTSCLIISETKDGGYINGVAQKSALIPIRADDIVIVNMENLIRSLGYAFYKGAHITTTSMGNVLGDGLAVDSVLRKGISMGGISFAAAGQFGGWDMDILPARSSYAVSCVASNIERRPWRKAFRSGYIKIAAPGESVWVADAKKDQPYGKLVGRYCGTSFSTAFTASSAALWYGLLCPETLHKKYGKDKIFYLYMKTLRDYGIETPANWDTIGYGPGILNVFNHITGSKNLPPLKEVEDFAFNYAKENDVTETEKTVELVAERKNKNALSTLLKLFSADEKQLENIFSNVGMELRFYLRSSSTLKKSILSFMENVQLNNLDEEIQQLEGIKKQLKITGSEMLNNFLKQ